MKGQASTLGPHSHARFTTISTNLGRLQDAAVATIGQSESDNLGHDARRNAQEMFYLAAAWEHHCRITGQHPHAFTNPDGSPDKQSPFR